VLDEFGEHGPGSTSQVRDSNADLPPLGSRDAVLFADHSSNQDDMVSVVRVLSPFRCLIMRRWLTVRVW
jgi:hypothetical protein